MTWFNRCENKAGGMREGAAQAGAGVQWSKAFGREEDRGFQLSSSAPLMRQNKMPLGFNSNKLPGGNLGPGQGGESTLCARKKKERKLSQGAASSMYRGPGGSSSTPAVQPERPQILGTRLGSKEAKEGREQAAQTPLFRAGRPRAGMGLGEGSQGLQPQAGSASPGAAHRPPRGWPGRVVSCLEAKGWSGSAGRSWKAERRPARGWRQSQCRKSPLGLGLRECGLDA